MSESRAQLLGGLAGALDARMSTLGLPPALAPWSATLSQFPIPLALALAPMVQRLALAIGPLATGGDPGGGEPDGLSGIVRRGPYERLLLSEWLLAEEVPEEFLRRAAEAEHRFLQLARREPKTDRTSIVLFDSGPDQMGSPRLAHLAALIVFARRAQAAGAEFAWGAVQDLECSLEQDLSTVGLRHFLLSRTAIEADSEALTRWSESLQFPWEGGSGLDLWLIGAPRLGKLAAEHGMAHLAIRDVLEPGARELEASVHERGRIKTVQLPLPGEEECSRLLRDPFRTATVAPVREREEQAPVSNLIWATEGKLLARAADGALVVYPIPNSPRATAGKIKRFPVSPSSYIVAAGRVGKTLVGVTAETEGGPMTLRALDGKLIYKRIVDRAFPEDSDPAPAPDAPLGHCIRVPEGRGSIAVLIEGRVGLLEISEAGYVSWAWSGARRNAAAIAPVAEGVVFAWRADKWYTWAYPFQHDPQAIECPEHGGLAFIGSGNEGTPMWNRLMALQWGPCDWLIPRHGGNVMLRQQVGTKMVGVIGTETGPALVLLEHGERIITVIGAKAGFSLPCAPAPIAHVSVSPFQPHIAYSTVDGDLFVYSLFQKVWVYVAEAQR